MYIIYHYGKNCNFYYRIEIETEYNCYEKNIKVITPEYRNIIIFFTNALILLQSLQITRPRATLSPLII